MPNVGHNTVFLKNPSTRFVVKNIAPNGKRVRVFQYPIVSGATRDLLDIPFVSEADIRHSLLKGELLIKFRCKELIVVDADIDLLQFNDDQKAFLESIGITKGLEVSGGGASVSAFFHHENINLIGIKNESNRIFTTPEIFINGPFNSHDFSIRIRNNGQALVENENYLLSESGGTGTGFDTITFISFKPKASDTLVADYVTET